MAIASGPLVFAISVAPPLYFWNVEKELSHINYLMCEEITRIRNNSSARYLQLFAVLRKWALGTGKLIYISHRHGLEKKEFIYFYLMDVSRRCVRISAAEINIM